MEAYCVKCRSKMEIKGSPGHHDEKRQARHVRDLSRLRDQGLPNRRRRIAGILSD